MKKIVLFASGNGTNVEKIIHHFYYHESVSVVGVFSNNAEAYVLERAKNYGIPSVVFTREELYHTNRVERLLIDMDADLLVLAGFLWLIPSSLIASYPQRILNIHPALLPKYGGKGMYGQRVHRAVIANEEQESGITIHYVNEVYDKGQIIHQEKCTVEPGETPDSLAEKIHRLEYEAYPEVIESVAMELK